MTSAWLVARSGLRARWRSWLALALVAGLAGGLVIALAAGARRADAAYPSLEAWSRPPAELIGLDAGKDFASVSATQARTLPQVSAVTSFTGFVTLNPVEIGVMAPADATVPGALWHRKLLAGRLPAPGRADEADISFATAQSLHVGVGDLLPVTFLGASGRPVRAQFRVVGVDAAPSEFPPQYGTAIDIVWTTPAFGQRMSATVTSTRNLALWLRHGPADLPAVEAGISRMAGGKALSEYPLAPQAANTRRSIHLQAVTLWLLAGLLALLGLIITGQLLIRLTAVESAGFPVLAAVGMSPAQLTVAGLARAAIIGAAGAVLALAVALGLSPLFPVGLAAVAELHPGVDADWPALLAGMAAVVAAMVACAAWPARRAATRRAGPAGDQPSLAGQARWSGITRAYHPVALAMGIRLALRRGAGRAAVPVLSTVAAATVGVIGLGVALVFTTSLNHLLATPRLYGVTWDALVVNLQNGPVDSVAAEVARDGGAARWSAAYTGVPVQVNGIQVGVITTSGNPGDTLAAVPARGRPPRGRNEIVLGERTLAAVHARVGATVMVDIPGMGKPAPRTVVGTAVFPAMGDETQLGSGAELTTDGLRDLVPPGVPIPPPGALLVQFQPGAAAQDAAGSPRLSALSARVEKLGAFGVSPPTTPQDLVNFGQLQALPLLTGGALGVLTLLTIAHLLLTSVRQRRREIAVLRAIGFTPRQARAAVAWMAAALAAPALAVGIPLGIACGRLAWQAFVGQFGIQPEPVVAPSPFLAVAAAAPLLAVAIAAVPGMTVSRLRLAQVLRAE